MLRRVPVHGYIYKKHRALLRALRVEKQKEPAQWMRRCGFRTGGPMGLPQLQVPRPLHCKGQRASSRFRTEGPMGLPQFQVPRPLHCKGQRASGRFHPGPYRPGFRRRRAVLWQLAELGMGSGGRRASQSDAAHPGGFYGTDAPEELSFGTPGGPGGQRRYTGRLRIVPMTSEAIFRRLPMGGSLGEALRKEGGPLEGSSGQRPGMTASSTPAWRDGPMLPAFGDSGVVHAPDESDGCFGASFILALPKTFQRLFDR